jgi:hypothetical protein
MLAAPMARLQQKTQAAVTTGTPTHAGLPCAMVLRLIRDLLGVPGFLATVALPTQCLIPASGNQDHTISPTAPIPLVARNRLVHRIPRQRS